MTEDFWHGLGRCPRHGHPLSLVAVGQPYDLGTQVNVVASCPQCRLGWVIHLVFSQDRDDVKFAGSMERGSRCGTNAGHQQHYRRGEPACRACLEAHARYKQAASARKRREREARR